MTIVSHWCLSLETISLYWSFRTHSEHKFVRFRIDDLLGDVEVGQRVDRAEEGDVALPQLEHRAVADGSAQHRVADQGPALATRQLSVIL